MIFPEQFGCFPKIGGVSPKMDGKKNGFNGMIWGENPRFSETPVFLSSKVPPFSLSASHKTSDLPFRPSRLKHPLHLMDFRLSGLEAHESNKR